MREAQPGMRLPRNCSALTEVRPLILRRGATYAVLVNGSLIMGLGIRAVLRTIPPGPGIAALMDTADVIGAMWVNAIRMTVTSTGMTAFRARS